MGTPAMTVLIKTRKKKLPLFETEPKVESDEP
jgi:hypothetical protein